MAAGASDGGNGRQVVVSSQYLIVAVVLLSMIVGGGVVFLLVSDGSGSPKAKVIDSNGQPSGQQGRGGGPGNAPASTGDPVKDANNARLSQLDRLVGAKNPQSTQQAVDDIRNWIGQEPRYAAAVLGETHTSKNIVPRLVKDCKAYQQTIELVDAATAALSTKTSGFSGIVGGIGLGTYETQAEYRNIKVEKGGKVLYSSNFDAGAEGWKPESGSWIMVAGAYRNSASGTFVSYLGEDSWTDYTLSLQARKISGKEGFIIYFGHKGNTKFNWNLGGYTNKSHLVEYNGQALDHSDVGARVAGSIDTNRWYDIKIQLNGSKYACYLDGRLVHQFEVTSDALNQSMIQGMRHWKAVALNESGRPDEAADLEKVNIQSGWVNISKTMTDLVTPMVNRKNHDPALKVVRSVATGCPQESDTVESALNQSVNILHAQQKYEEALAEAKTLFNYSTLEHTSDALKTLDRELQQVFANNRAKIDLFHDEQVKGSTASGQPVISSVVKAIPVGSLDYTIQMQSITGTDYPSLIKKGALQLLSDQGNQAETTFKQALDAAGSLDDKQAARNWIARSIKAQDGTIGRANQWITGR